MGRYKTVCSELVCSHERHSRSRDASKCRRIYLVACASFDVSVSKEALREMDDLLITIIYESFGVRGITCLPATPKICISDSFHSAVFDRSIN